MKFADFSSPYVIIFTAGTLITFFVNHILEFVDYHSRKLNGGHVPKILENIPEACECFTDEKLEKIVAYENAKYRAWIPNSILSLILTLVMVLCGFYPWVFALVCKITGVPSGFWSLYFCYFIFSILTSIPRSILSLPFDLYDEFSLEKKFGFSNMTFKLWIVDEIKSTLIGLITSLVLGIFISLAFTYFVTTWWLIISVIIIVFVFIIMIIYPKFIAPLFNKFEPLPEGELKEKISELLDKTGFKNGGLFIMDESKRSGHSNAFFSGFGKNKRIVLYDTLVKQLTTDELVAVLAHELGHFKLKHTTKRLVLVFPLVFLSTFILYNFSQFPSLYEAFGFHLADGLDIRWIQFIGLTLAGFVWGSVSEIITPIGNIFSRKDEYQADAFAAKSLGESRSLITGLIKLNSENLNELFPPAIYVWWNYSHPTLTQRIEALQKIN